MVPGKWRKSNHTKTNACTEQIRSCRREQKCDELFKTDIRCQLWSLSEHQAWAEFESRDEEMKAIEALLEPLQ